MDINTLADFKKRFQEGPVVGTFSKTEDPAMVEAMGYGGLDFVILDMEHGSNSTRSVQNLIRAAELSGIFPIVRVKENNPGLISEVLDIGAYGVQIPQINNRTDAETVVKFARFAPAGERGICRFVRAADYSTKDRFAYFEDSMKSLLIMQVEGSEGIEAMDDILQVPEVDCIFIGPYDLSQSLGVPGQIDHPKVEKAMCSIVDRCRGKGVLVGTFVDTPENAQKWKDAGVHYLAYGVDVGLLADKAAEVKKAILG